MLSSHYTVAVTEHGAISKTHHSVNWYSGTSRLSLASTKLRRALKPHKRIMVKNGLGWTFAGVVTATSSETETLCSGPPTSSLDLCKCAIATACHQLPACLASAAQCMRQIQSSEGCWTSSTTPLRVLPLCHTTHTATGKAGLQPFSGCVHPLSVLFRYYHHAHQYSAHPLAFANCGCGR